MDTKKEKKIATKKPKGASASGKKADAPRVCVMHESNFALSLASGFIGPRAEESAAADHHQKNGGLTTSIGKPLESHMRLAMGSLDYGNLVLVELKGDVPVTFRTTSAFEAIAESPIPLAYVAQVFARSQGERDEIIARLEAYSDIPQGLIEILVDSDRFVALQDGLNLEVESLPTSLEWQAVSLRMDKLAGAINAIVQSACGRNNGLTIIAAALKPGPVLEPAFESLGARLSEIVDTGSAQVAATALLKGWLGVLSRRTPRAGFDPGLLLEELAATEANESDKKLMDSFCKHAGDVIAGRRDVGPDAFADAPGKIQSRAILFSLLNLDPERLQAAQKRIPNVGASVFLLASYFVGLAYGLSMLPSSMKAGSKYGFFAVASFTASAAKGDVPVLDRTMIWSEDGTGESRLMFGGMAMATESVLAPQSLRRAMRVAQEAGIEAKFGPQDGVLWFVGNDDRPPQRCRVTSGPLFPIQEVIEISDGGGSLVSKKDASIQLLAAIVSMEESKVFARVKSSGKLYAIERFVYCGLDAPPAAYKAASEALVAAALVQGVTKPEEPKSGDDKV